VIHWGALDAEVELARIREERHIVFVLVTPDVKRHLAHKVLILPKQKGHLVSEDPPPPDVMNRLGAAARFATAGGCTASACLPWTYKVTRPPPAGVFTIQG